MVVRKWCGVGAFRPQECGPKTRCSKENAVHVGTWAPVLKFELRVAFFAAPLVCLLPSNILGNAPLGSLARQVFGLEFSEVEIGRTREVRFRFDVMKYDCLSCSAAAVGLLNC